MQATRFGRLARFADRLITLAAYEAAIAAVAARRGVSIDEVRTASPQRGGWTRQVRGAHGRFGAARTQAAPSARAEALYLTHTVFGRPLSAIARTAEISKPGVSKAIARVEDARDDPGLDRALDALKEQLMGEAA